MHIPREAWRALLRRRDAQADVPLLVRHDRRKLLTESGRHPPFFASEMLGAERRGVACGRRCLAARLAVGSAHSATWSTSSCCRYLAASRAHAEFIGDPMTAMGCAKIRPLFAVTKLALDRSRLRSAAISAICEALPRYSTSIFRLARISLDLTKLVKPPQTRASTLPRGAPTDAACECATLSAPSCDAALRTQRPARQAVVASAVSPGDSSPSDV